MFSFLLIFACCTSLVGSLAINPTHTDGMQYLIKSVNITYNQRISDHNQCSVELQDRPKHLVEGQVVKLKSKFFKVEECRLNRAYRAPCGSRLFFQLQNLVCATAKQTLHQRQVTNYEPINFLQSSGSSECCETACTIAEFFQYCSS
ncbi:unnamed protein product [Adineta ricciae]|uniref:Uncharacterized protein n=1 Tax=Adineta ricciae TaxID=249248 RepID=A0A813Y008_ADIRI|nr:unnamed protein product [Adineta ricciae]CAF0897437.1 unnamed protein product [Adineta ricciae]